MPVLKNDNSSFHWQVDSVNCINQLVSISRQQIFVFISKHELYSLLENVKAKDAMWLFSDVGFEPMN